MVRDGQVRNTPFYVVMGVTTNGEREILGIWAGDGGEGARFWLQVFSELKNRGVEDVLIAVCDGFDDPGTCGVRPSCASFITAFRRGFTTVRPGRHGPPSDVSVT